jgi:hypothetical protein
VVLITCTIFLHHLSSFPWLNSTPRF